MNEWFECPEDDIYCEEMMDEIVWECPEEDPYCMDFEMDDWLPDCPADDPDCTGMMDDMMGGWECPADDPTCDPIYFMDDWMTCAVDDLECNEMMEEWERWDTMDDFDYDDFIDCPVDDPDCEMVFDDMMGEWECPADDPNCDAMYYMDEWVVCSGDGSAEDLECQEMMNEWDEWDTVEWDDYMECPPEDPDCEQMFTDMQGDW